jgi:hypothetical protein
MPAFTPPPDALFVGGCVLVIMAGLAVLAVGLWRWAGDDQDRD